MGLEEALVKSLSVSMSGPTGSHHHHHHYHPSPPQCLWFCLSCATHVFGVWTGWDWGWQIAAVDLAEETNRSCSVCLEEHELGEIVVKLPCAHIFHRREST